MLQIISGRFFTGGSVNESERDAILYSNYSWILPIKTDVVEMRPVEFGRGMSAYVLRYVNRYEPRPGDVLYLAHDQEVVDQFRLLASFYFKAFFHVDRSYVETMCRTGSRHGADNSVPSFFIPRFFDVSIHGELSEATGFIAFLSKVLGMPRTRYRSLIAALQGFFDALEALGRNFDLAYSMMVYVLEALSRSTEQPAVVWSDYDSDPRSRLNRELANIEPGSADRLKAILLRNPHLQLMKRYRRFILDHVSDAFFISEAEKVTSAIARSELERALNNLYAARSGYVHELKNVHEQLRLTGLGKERDVFHWPNEPHLTFSGLVRLSHHVIGSFIHRQRFLSREEYHDWRQELPGIVSMAIAPQYWVWQPDSFEPGKSARWFGGFADLVVDELSKPSITLPDMRPVLLKIEAILQGAHGSDRVRPEAREERVRMVAIHILFNAMVAPDLKTPGWQAFSLRFDALWTQCSIEFMTALVILGLPIPWSPGDTATTFERYQKSRYKDHGIRLLRTTELALMSAIANVFLANGDVAAFEDWVERALGDAGGRGVLQDGLRVCKAARQVIDVNKVLRPAPAQATATVGEAEVRIAAYLKWIEAGRPSGRETEFWLSAETEATHRSNWFSAGGGQ